MNQERERDWNDIEKYEIIPKKKGCSDRLKKNKLVRVLAIGAVVVSGLTGIGAAYHYHHHDEQKSHDRILLTLVPHGDPFPRTGSDAFPRKKSSGSAASTNVPNSVFDAKLTAWGEAQKKMHAARHSPDQYARLKKEADRLYLEYLAEIKPALDHEN